MGSGLGRIERFAAADANHQVAAALPDQRDKPLYFAPATFSAERLEPRRDPRQVQTGFHRATHTVQPLATAKHQRVRTEAFQMFADFLNRAGALNISAGRNHYFAHEFPSTQLFRYALCITTVSRSGREIPLPEKQGFL